jgi:four helix bundle protein
MRQNKPRDLCERTFLFARDIVRFCVPLARTAGAIRQISAQLLRCGTSVGANAEEAKAAYGRRDFGYRNGVVLREARESHFWLRLIGAAGMADQKLLQPLIDEANELVAIYTVTVKKTRPPRKS